ncbi:ComEC/Rec2 family competence protein [Pseudomonas sp. KCJK9058]|uniref:ComEC/Rec2 family competence protein n=1 Tax=Pseudomonas sp. KCJK9058 TaxID=3344563 RepID=UPI0039058C5E
MLEIQFLPAREGDSIWLRWGDDLAFQMLVDMGTAKTGLALRKRLEALPEDRRNFELVVITHIDCDHINGVLSALVDNAPIPGLSVKDFWFNGLAHLEYTPSSDPLEELGAVQGEKLGEWLKDKPWNFQFGGGPVCRDPNQAPPVVELADGLQITVLGPTPQRLKQLLPTWQKEWREALAKYKDKEGDEGCKLEALGASKQLTLTDTLSLIKLANKRTKSDNSRANGSSIALLIEYKGKRVLLSGDAFASDLVEAIQSIDANDPIRLDAFKLPHHGSSKNVSRELVKSVVCDHWIISTDGNRFRHPDDEAVARLIYYSAARPARLGFNIQSEINERWDNEAWRKQFGYVTSYGDSENGLTLTYGPPKPV